MSILNCLTICLYYHNIWNVINFFNQFAFDPNLTKSMFSALNICFYMNIKNYILIFDINIV